MPTADTTPEVNAAAGQVGTTYRLTLDGRDPHFRVNSAPNRTATVRIIDGTPLRHATIDHEDQVGEFSDLVVGVNETVTEGSRLFVLLHPGATTAVVVEIS